MKTIILMGFDSSEKVNVDTGMVTRIRNGQVFHNGSKDWIVKGFILLNNFGNQIGYLTRAEFFETMQNNPDSLFYKNRKAKFRVADIDHGTNRTWGQTFNRSQVYISR